MEKPIRNQHLGHFGLASLSSQPARLESQNNWKIGKSKGKLEKIGKYWKKMEKPIRNQHFHRKLQFCIGFFQFFPIWAWLAGRRSDLALEPSHPELVILIRDYIWKW